MLDQRPFIKIQDGTFSEYTFSARYPEILLKVISHQFFDDGIQLELTELKDSLSSLRIKRLNTTSNNNYWDNFYLNYENSRLLDIPFFHAEVYFFAMIREVTRYHELNVDPFDRIKQRDLQKHIHLLEDTISKSQEWESQDFILFALQGNKSDLSQLSEGVSIKLNLLINHTKELIDHCVTKKNCHIIQDNCGLELFSDLLLANHLVDNYNHTVYLHLKSEPIFVSDSLIKDLNALLEVMANKPIADSIKKKINQGNIIIKTSKYWSSPNDFQYIIKEIDVNENSLIISKGDANYRRFFSDKQLDPTIDSKSLTQYLKTPAFCIRTLKSEIQTNIPFEKVEYLNDKTPNWMSNGSYAVIQYINMPS